MIWAKVVTEFVIDLCTIQILQKRNPKLQCFRKLSIALFVNAFYVCKMCVKYKQTFENILDVAIFDTHNPIHVTEYVKDDFICYK